MSENIGEKTQEIFNKFKDRFKDLADECLGELYTDVAIHFDGDMYSNYREEIRLEMEHEYKYSKFKDEWARNLRRAIFVENREECSKLISEDILKRIKELEDLKQEYDMFRYSERGVYYKDLLAQKDSLLAAIKVLKEACKDESVLNSPELEAIKELLDE